MKIGLIVTLDKEYEAIVKAWLPDTPSERKEKLVDGCRMIGLYPNEDDEVIIVRCGIGKVNAAAATLLLANENVACIISSGAAGGVDVALRPGMTVVGLQYNYHDVYCGKETAKGQIQGEPVCYYADAQLLEIEGTMEMDTVAGSVVSGDQFVDSKQEMGRILDDYPSAIAVDMESCAIAQVCSKRSIPFIAFRMISDVLLNPAAKRHEDFWNKVPLQMASNTMRFVAKVLNVFHPF